ncbi:hypothetical protein TSAR_007540 [Trichomalopsis sarcophagae]|uniref:Uncharacterized protein n=1 Tax=Trichomalopsis sarcophagae TaxID=543379 RepID=A0A232EFW2_9HYME|nr:hypothetical protein TSAR_007540 [Trichomalopsis sarcophagae]
MKLSHTITVPHNLNTLPGSLFISQKPPEIQKQSQTITSTKVQQIEKRSENTPHLKDINSVALTEKSTLSLLTDIDYTNLPTQAAILQRQQKVLETARLEQTLKQSPLSNNLLSSTRLAQGINSSKTMKLSHTITVPHNVNTLPGSLVISQKPPEIQKQSQTITSTKVQQIEKRSENAPHLKDINSVASTEKSTLSLLTDTDYTNLTNDDNDELLADIPIVDPSLIDQSSASSPREQDSDSVHEQYENAFGPFEIELTNTNGIVNEENGDDSMSNQSRSEEENFIDKDNADIRANDNINVNVTEENDRNEENMQHWHDCCRKVCTKLDALCKDVRVLQEICENRDAGEVGNNAGHNYNLLPNFPLETEEELENFSGDLENNETS